MGPRSPAEHKTDIFLSPSLLDWCLSRIFPSSNEVITSAAVVETMLVLVLSDLFRCLRASSPASAVHEGQMKNVDLYSIW